MSEERRYNAYTQNLKYGGGGFTTKHKILDGFSVSADRMTDFRTFDFIRNYRLKYNSAWIPDEVYEPPTPMLITPTQKYSNHIGMLPNYCGHIPGGKFRYGKTFGNDTRDCKRWLRGDFTI